VLAIGVSRRRGDNLRSRRTTRRGPFLSAALRPRLAKSERLSVELGGKGRNGATPAQTATRADRLKCAETNPAAALAALPGRPRRTLRHQPRGFRMLPIADVKETRYGATIKVTRKNRENA